MPFFPLKKTAPAIVLKNGLDINMYLYLHEESMWRHEHYLSIYRYLRNKKKYKNSSALDVFFEIGCLFACPQTPLKQSQII